MTQQHNSKAVSVIGLGDMGSVLADILLKNGHSVTVWNRNAQKAAPLIAQGAIAVASTSEAVSASPIIIICVKDYEASRSILNDEATKAALKDRLLIELSTGTPQDARNAETWAKQAGAAYLDGAILATPPQVGKPDTPIFVSGAVSAYQQGEATLRTLAGSLQYMGEAVGAAAAWDLAFLAAMFGGMIGFIHGAALLETENISVEDYGNMMAALAPVIGEMIRHEGHVIQHNTFNTPQSTLNTSAITFKLLLQHAEESGISKDFPQFAMELFSKAQRAGYGGEEVGTIIKVIRKAG